MSSACKSQTMSCLGSAGVELPTIHCVTWCAMFSLCQHNTHLMATSNGSITLNHWNHTLPLPRTSDIGPTSRAAVPACNCQRDSPSGNCAGRCCKLGLILADSFWHINPKPLPSAGMTMEKYLESKKVSYALIVYIDWFPLGSTSQSYWGGGMKKTIALSQAFSKAVRRFAVAWNLRISAWNYCLVPPKKRCLYFVWPRRRASHHPAGSILGLILADCATCTKICRGFFLNMRITWHWIDWIDHISTNLNSVKHTPSTPRRNRSTPRPSPRRDSQSKTCAFCPKKIRFRAFHEFRAYNTYYEYVK